MIGWVQIKALGVRAASLCGLWSLGALPGDGGAARQGFYLYASGCGKEILFGGDVVQAGEVINGASESKRNLQDTL